MHKSISPLILALFVLCVPAVEAEMYSWTDNNGPNFTDAIGNIPQKYMGSANIIHNDGTREPVKVYHKKLRKAELEAEKQKQEEIRRKEEAKQVKAEMERKQAKERESSYRYSGGGSGNYHTLENCQVACGGLFSTSSVDYRACVRDCRP